VDVDQDCGDLELQEDQGCYVYGVVPSDAQGLGVSGLDDAPVRLLRFGPVAAVVSAVRLERPAGRRHDLLAHSRVLDAYAANGPVVPVRFGSILTDPEAVRSELLEPRKERFVELLAELTGAVQFNLQARYDEATVLTEVVGSNPEIARLRERTRDRSEEESYADRVRLGELVSNELAARREGDAHTVLTRLQPHVLAHRERAGGSIDHLTDLALLVDIARRDAFETAAEKLAADMHERARLRLLGPMAPYDFVGED
jgi:hypothetical protein